MNKEQTAQQLELAAQIIRTEHPFMVSPKPNGLWCMPTQAGMDVLKWPVDKYEIRPVLATPPDGRPLHNPDNLTAEQVGVGYRLMLPEEVDGRHEGKCQVWNGLGAWSSSEAEGTHKKYSYRLPLSVPWSEPKPDPYAELKKAHAEGKVIQFVDDGDIWRDIDEPNWKLSANEYRIKPKLTFQLPPPPPGMQWHRTDGWGDGDLPQGYRPLLVDELPKEGDECITKPFESEWCESNNWRNSSQASAACHYRTRRPLTFTHAGKQWTWHRLGNPMPCGGEMILQILLSDGEANRDFAQAKYWDWEAEDKESDVKIIGWRYVDDIKTVPLERHDITPYTRLRVKNVVNRYTDWITPSTVNAAGITFATTTVSFDTLAADYERNDSLQAKWDPDAWGPCTKTVKK